jgi:hypothetical protein
MSHATPPRRGLPRTVIVLTSVLAVGALAWAVVVWPWGGGSDNPATAGELASPTVPSARPTPSAVSRTPAPSRASRGPRFDPDAPVELIGDSLAVGIQIDVSAGLAPRLVTTDAAEGRGTATAVSLLSYSAASTPSVWIVSLGTNDNPEEFADSAADLLALAGPDRCVVWFDVWRSDTQELINAELASLAETRPNVHVIPWYETSLANPEWFSGTDVHPSTKGYAERARLGVQAVAQHCTR